MQRYLLLFVDINRLKEIRWPGKLPGSSIVIFPEVHHGLVSLVMPKAENVQASCSNADPISLYEGSDFGNCDLSPGTW